MLGDGGFCFASQEERDGIGLAAHLHSLEGQDGFGVFALDLAPTSSFSSLLRPGGRRAESSAVGDLTMAFGVSRGARVKRDSCSISKGRRPASDLHSSSCGTASGRALGWAVACNKRLRCLSPFASPPFPFGLTFSQLGVSLGAAGSGLVQQLGKRRG